MRVGDGDAPGCFVECVRVLYNVWTGADVPTTLFLSFIVRRDLGPNSTSSRPKVHTSANRSALARDSNSIPGHLVCDR